MIRLPFILCGLLMLLLVGTQAPVPVCAAMRPAAIVSRGVTFAGGRDRIAGTIELPASARPHSLPAALILPGSGPIDRNGNAPIAGLTHLNTLRDFAATLAAAGVASLRYDKLGVGGTPVGSHNPQAIGFDVDIGEARAAYRYLAARPEVDPHRIAILGHSEGALLALILGSDRTLRPLPRALVLAAPPGLPILETIHEQLVADSQRALGAGLVTAAQVSATTTELDRIIASLKTSGTLPAQIKSPELASIFRLGVVKQLVQEERYDPRVLAAGVPWALPVLVLHGTSDPQISAADIAGLRDAFLRSGHTRAAFAELPGVDHLFKHVPAGTTGQADDNNSALRLSAAAVRRVDAFLRRYL